MAFPTIPTVAGGRVLTANQADTAGTRTFPDLSGLTKNAGDLLIAICVVYQSSAAAGAVFSGWSAGWTEFLDGGGTTSNMSIGVAYKWSTGSETGTISVTQAATITGHASMILLSIPGAHASTPPEGGAIAHGTTAAADPAALDPAGWDAEDALWIAVGASGMTSGTGSWTGVASAPANYTDFAATNTTDNSTVGQVEAAVAFRQLNASSENVGPFSVDTSNARNSAVVIAVRPAVVLSKAQVSWASLEVPGVTSTPKAGTESGSGADASVERATYPLTDSGTRTEVAALSAAYPRTDTGSGSDASAVRVPKAGTDSGAGTDASAEHVAHTVTDAGSGADTVKTKASLVAQTGSGTEVSSTHAAYVSTDSGTGTEVAKVSRPVADTGTGTDASTGHATYARADAGTGADASTEHASYNRGDSGSGADASATNQLARAQVSWAAFEISVPTAKSGSDTGSGVDSSAVAKFLVATDTGAGSDTSSVISPMRFGADAGFGFDRTAAAGLVFLFRDGEELARLAAALLRADTGAGSDTSSVQTGGTPKAGTDAGSGSEASSVTRTYAVAQPGTGVDTSAERAVYARTDTGSGLDTSSLQAGNLKQGSDVASGADTSSLRTSLAKSEVGVGNDLRTIHASLSRADAGTGADAGRLLLRRADTGTGLDASLTRGLLTRVDTAGSAEVAALYASLILIDVGSTLDTGGKWAGALPPARVTATVGLSRGGESSTITGDRLEATIKDVREA